MASTPLENSGLHLDIKSRAISRQADDNTADNHFGEINDERKWNYELHQESIYCNGVRHIIGHF